MKIRDAEEYNYFNTADARMNIATDKPALTKKVASNPPTRKIAPITRGPNVCPNRRTIPLSDIKAARYSIGASLAKSV